MIVFKWTNDFSVNVETFDREHETIVKLLDRMNEAVRLGNEQEVAGEVLDELIRYASTHFANEEALMKEHGFPDYERHKAIHDDLAAQVSNYRGRYRRGAMNAVEVVQFLLNWLEDHVMTVDKLYGPFLASRGVK